MLYQSEKQLFWSWDSTFCRSVKNTSSHDNPVYNLDLSPLPLMTPEFNWEANSLLHSAVRSSFSWCRLSISSHNIMHSLPSVWGLRNPDRGVEASSGVVSGRGDEDAAWEWAGQSSCGRVNPASVVLSISTIPDISKSPLTIADTSPCFSVNNFALFVALLKRCSRFFPFSKEQLCKWANWLGTLVPDRRHPSVQRLSPCM